MYLFIAIIIAETTKLTVGIQFQHITWYMFAEIKRYK